MSLRVAGRLLLLLLVWFALGGWSFFDPFHKWIEKGNGAATGGEVEDALSYYGEAARTKPSSPIPDFNSGIVHAHNGEAEPAKSDFLAAAASPDSGVAADALYNLGNVLLQEQDARGAIEAYLRSLDLDPDDPDARRNLELAAQLLEQQEQQQQQQQQEQQQKDEQDEEQEQQQQQWPDETPPNEEDSQNESPQADDQQEEEPQPEERQLPPEERLSREDAERLLNAIESDELKVLEQLHDKDDARQGVSGNDW